MSSLTDESAATAVELGAFFDDERRGGDMAFDVRGAAEDELFGGANVALDGSIDLRNCNIDLSFRDLCAGADDERSVFRSDVAGEVAVDTQHRFEADFTREIHHVAYKPKPIVFIHVGSTAIDEFRLAAFVSARNCLSSHCCPLSVLCPRVNIRVGGKPPGAAAAA